MVMTYNKVYKKSDGRKLVAGGPRDLQLKQKSRSLQSSEDLLTLRKEVERLVNSNRTQDMDSTDFATVVDEAIEELSIELEKRYIERISDLESTIAEKIEYIKRLESKLDKQDEIIYNLTNKVAAAPVYTVAAPLLEDDRELSNSNRPSIDNIVIDPTKKGSEDKLESHVTTKEVTTAKSTTSTNINKLKDLMGSKLP